MLLQVVVVASLFASAAYAQQTLFEVAAVRINKSGDMPRSYPRFHNGTFTARNASMRTLLVVAFGIIELRIQGPGWLDTERYDITARTSGEVRDSDVKPALQVLLKEHFGLQWHSETN